MGRLGTVARAPRGTLRLRHLLPAANRARGSRREILAVWKPPMACDLDQSRADGLAALVPGCRATTDLAEALLSSAQVVIVATANHALAPLALEAVKAGKHVLIEKPGAIRASELETLAAEAEAR